MPNLETLYRSTTPKLILHIKDPEFDMESIDQAHITIENDSGRNKKIFTETAINIEDRTISIEMTQEDTLSFEPGCLNVQLKIRTTDGLVLASKIITSSISRILEEDIL